MIKLENVLNCDNSRTDYNFDDGLNNKIIDGTKLLALPGLIDPHVHFRVPGMEHKEDWVSGSLAAFKGGYTTVFDMPNTIPATTTQLRLKEKFNLINEQLKTANRPLKYKLFFGADKNNFNEIVKVKDEIAGIKVFMGSSTGELLMDDESSLHAIYAIAKAFNLVVALHAEDELTIRSNSKLYSNETDFKYHSIIRSPEAAVKAVELVIKLSEIYQVKSYILHVSTKMELDLVKDAKMRGISVFIETCPHYLFLDDSAYSALQGLAKMNPPLRTISDQEYLWKALNSGIIDTIGSDHAPHTLDEKDQPLCKCPSGIPGIETTLPLMLTAYKKQKVSLNKIVELLSTNPKQLFNLPDNQDMVFANIHDYHKLEVKDLCTKVGWSPFIGMNLTGYPEYIYASGKFFSL